MSPFKKCKKDKEPNNKTTNSETNTRNPRQQTTATNTSSEEGLEEKRSMSRRSVIRTKSESGRSKSKTRRDPDYDEVSRASEDDEEEECDEKGRKGKRKAQNSAVIEVRIVTNQSEATMGKNDSCMKVSDLECSPSTCPPPLLCPKCNNILNEKNECTKCNACVEKAAKAATMCPKCNNVLNEKNECAKCSSCVEKAAKAPTACPKCTDDLNEKNECTKCNSCIEKTAKAPTECPQCNNVLNEKNECIACVEKAAKAPTACPHCQIQHSQNFYPPTPQCPPPQAKCPPNTATQMGFLSNDCFNLTDTENEEMRTLEADLIDFHRARRKLITDSKIFACNSNDVSSYSSNFNQDVSSKDETEDSQPTDRERKSSLSKKRSPFMPVSSDLNVTEAQEAKSMEAALKEFQKARRNLIDKLKGYSC